MSNSSISIASVALLLLSLNSQSAHAGLRGPLQLQQRRLLNARHLPQHGLQSPRRRSADVFDSVLRSRARQLSAEADQHERMLGNKEDGGKKKKKKDKTKEHTIKMKGKEQKKDKDKNGKKPKRNKDKKKPKRQKKQSKPKPNKAAMRPNKQQSNPKPKKKSNNKPKKNKKSNNKPKKNKKSNNKPKKNKKSSNKPKKNKKSNSKSNRPKKKQSSKPNPMNAAAGSKPGKDKPIEIDTKPTSTTGSKPGKHGSRSKSGKDKNEGTNTNVNADVPFASLLEQLGLVESDLSPEQQDYLHALTNGKLDLSQDTPPPKPDGGGPGSFSSRPDPADAKPDPDSLANTSLSDQDYPTEKPTPQIETGKPTAKPTNGLKTKKPSASPTELTSKPTAKPTNASIETKKPSPSPTKLTKKPSESPTKLTKKPSASPIIPMNINDIEMNAGGPPDVKISRFKFVSSLTDQSIQLESFENTQHSWWTSNPINPWTLDDTDSFEGRWSITSGIPNNIISEVPLYSELTLTTDQQFEGGVLTFRLKAGSLVVPNEAFYVTVDGEIGVGQNVTASTSNNREWNEYSLAVSEGRHDVTFVHVYNPFGLERLPSSNTDSGLFLDDLRYIPFGGDLDLKDIEMLNNGDVKWVVDDTSDCVVASSQDRKMAMVVSADLTFVIYSKNGGTLSYIVDTSTTAPHDDFFTLLNDEGVDAIFGESADFELRTVDLPKGKVVVTLTHRENPGSFSNSVLSGLGGVETEGKTWLKDVSFEVR